MSRVRGVSTDRNGRVMIEFIDGTSSSLKKLPESEAVHLARQLDEVLDIHQRALTEVSE